MTINDAKLEEILLWALSQPFNNWDEVANKLMDNGDDSCQKGSDALTSMAVVCGLMSAYLGFRGAYGCGDRGHDNSLVLALKRQKMLRKANGYSYP